MHVCESKAKAVCAARHAIDEFVASGAVCGTRNTHPGQITGALDRCAYCVQTHSHDDGNLLLTSLQHVIYSLYLYLDAAQQRRQRGREKCFVKWLFAQN